MMNDFPESSGLEPVAGEYDHKPEIDPLRLFCMLDHGQLAIFDAVKCDPAATAQPVVSTNELPALDAAAQVR